MKTIICYPKSLAGTNSVNTSSWIIADYLNKQGYEVFYNEVPDGEDIDLTIYYDQLALYCLEDCLTAKTISKILTSRHILNSYSSSDIIEKKINGLFTLSAKADSAAVVLKSIQHRVSIKTTNKLLQELVWKEYYHTKPPAAIKKPISYPQFMQLVNL